MISGDVRDGMLSVRNDIGYANLMIELFFEQLKAAQEMIKSCSSIVAELTSEFYDGKPYAELEDLVMAADRLQEAKRAYFACVMNAIDLGIYDEESASGGGNE